MENDMTEYDMIHEMWLIIGDLPICRRESMGDDLFESVSSYLGYNDDEGDEVDSEIEED